MPAWLIPALTAALAALMAVGLIDQWLERRHPFQLAWAIGMGLFAIGSASEAAAAVGGWNEGLYRAWYLAGAVLTPAWLGLGTAFLLSRTRFGYAYALCFLLAGVFTVLSRGRYPDAGASPILYLIAGIILALAIFVETYFQNTRWPSIAAFGVIAGTLVGIVLALSVALPAPGYAVDPATDQPTAALFPGYLRLLTPFMNVTGAFSLALGAVFSAYVFMPKRRVLGYSLEPGQPFDQFLFNLFLGVIAIPVNLVLSIPGAVRAFRRGELHSRVPATVLIALGAFVAAAGDSLNRFGVTAPFAVAKLIAVVLLLAGFLVSIDAFRQLRVPFTGIRFGVARQERDGG